jgi:transcriptional regulator with XRE-family HTH domain
MRIGQIVKAYRTHKERTLREVADEIDISHGTLARIENGENVDGATLWKLMVWLFS